MRSSESPFSFLTLQSKVYNTYVEFPHFALIKFSTTSITRVHKWWWRKMRIVVVTWLALNARVWDTGCRPTYYCWGIISDTNVVPSTHFYILTCTWGAIHTGRVEPASPRENHGDVSWVVSTPRSPAPASLHYWLCSSIQACPVWERRSIRFSHPPVWF